MTLLAVSVSGSSVEKIREDINAAIELGADLVELRIDLMEGIDDDVIRSLCESCHAGIPIVLTIRSRAEGGGWDGPEDGRLSRLIELGPAVDYIDVELATWRRSANTRQKLCLALHRAGHISQAEGREEIKSATKRKLILSHHDLQSRPPTLQADFLAMLSELNCEIPKLAWHARTVRDNFEAFELMREAPRPSIIVCMGEYGLPSRVLARKFGAFATFASIAPGSETAAGQLSVADMKGLYRWDAINEDTHVYGVIGDPVRHSLSPRAHNEAFTKVDMNAVYLPMQVGPSYESFKAFMAEVLAKPWLDFRGFSVTVPHKEHALRYLQEVGGEIDSTAQRVGALNTVKLDPDGRLYGYNTDRAAAIDAICTGLNWQKGDLSGRAVAVLGAGGIAKAVVAGLVELGARITVFNRTESRAAALAERFGVGHLPWADRVNTDATLLVNCTSVGLWPIADVSPMPPDALRASNAVFDTVYHPLRTRLLSEARGRGCKTADGLAMFALQAQAQFKLWTGRDVGLELFREAAAAGLRGE